MMIRWLSDPLNWLLTKPVGSVAQLNLHRGGAVAMGKLLICILCMKSESINTMYNKHSNR